MHEKANPLKAGIYYGKYPTPDNLQSMYAPQQARLLHGALGVLTEAFEVFEIIYNGWPVPEHLEKELGDLGWFRSQIATVMDLDLDEVDRKNIVKLEVRYPEKFTEEQALNKDEALELKVMNE